MGRQRLSSSDRQILTISRNLITIKSYGGQRVYFSTCRYVNEIPKAGESMSAMFREKCYGGKAANQCVAARKLGASCALIAKLGNDDLGKEYFKYLSDMLINTEFLKLMDGESTGLAQINVDDRAANTIVVLYGANSKLSPKEVKDYKKLLKNAKVLLCQLESDPKAVLCALNMFKGVSVLNASPDTNKITSELIAAPTILCVNEIEAAKLTERDQVKTVYEAKAAANDLLLKGAKSVIITLGDQGAIHLSKKEQDRCIHCPAAPIRYLADTSGAGDAFLGSLAYHIARYPNLQREYHIHAANICAAHSVGQRGTQPSFPGPNLAQTDLCRQNPVFSLVPDEDPNANIPHITIKAESITHLPSIAIAKQEAVEAAAAIPVAAEKPAVPAEVEAKRATDAAKVEDAGPRKSEVDIKRDRLSARMSKSMLEPAHVPPKPEERPSQDLHKAAPSDTSQKTTSSAAEADLESKKDRLSSRLSRTMVLAQHPSETAKIMPKPVGGAHHLARSSMGQYKRHANVQYTHNRYVQKPKKRTISTKKTA